MTHSCWQHFIAPRLSKFFWKVFIGSTPPVPPKCARAKPLAPASYYSSHLAKSTHKHFDWAALNSFSDSFSSSCLTCLSDQVVFTVKEIKIVSNPSVGYYDLTCRWRKLSSSLGMTNDKTSYHRIIHNTTVIGLIRIPPPMLFISNFWVGHIGPLLSQKSEHAPWVVRVHCSISSSNSYHDGYALCGKIKTWQWWYSVSDVLEKGIKASFRIPMRRKRTRLNFPGNSFSCNRTAINWIVR